MSMSALQRRLSNKARLGGKPKLDRDSVKEKPNKAIQILEELIKRDINF